MMVAVSNLAEEGLTSLHCLAAEDSAAAVCVRNAVPCVCTRCAATAARARPRYQMGPLCCLA